MNTDEPDTLSEHTHANDQLDRTDSVSHQATRRSLPARPTLRNHSADRICTRLT
jgi:hypothetical protein